MIHVQVYRVLDACVVEIRCNHAEGQEATSHLVYRETYRPDRSDSAAVWECLSDAARHAWSAVYQGEVDVYDECGWV